MKTIVLKVGAIEGFQGGEVKVIRKGDKVLCIQFGLGGVVSLISHDSRHKLLVDTISGSQTHWFTDGGEIRLTLEQGEFLESDRFEWSCNKQMLHKVNGVVRGDGLTERVVNSNRPVGERGIREGEKVLVEGRYLRPANSWDAGGEWAVVDVGDSQFVRVLNQTIHSLHEIQHEAEFKDLDGAENVKSSRVGDFVLMVSEIEGVESVEAGGRTLLKGGRIWDVSAETGRALLGLLESFGKEIDTVMLCRGCNSVTI